MGATHEKANLDCDSFDCSDCHPQWNERGYCPTGPTVSSCGFPKSQSSSALVHDPLWTRRGVARTPISVSPIRAGKSPLLDLQEASPAHWVTQEGHAFPQGPK